MLVPPRHRVSSASASSVPPRSVPSPRFPSRSPAFRPHSREAHGAPRVHSFYGINLNQNVVLQQIGFDGSSGTPWERLFKIGIGNLIITALGFVPGYYVSILSIEYLGRKWIQIQGFLMAALFRESTGLRPCVMRK